ncbi:hypothetical protein HQ865_25255 [Mucilaginibacter mali]|uniref:Uncharacterized protein n=1 Tax=Mucilaginibacter mali TaxID=2740462 RepID=A0A7D4UFL2_9SPHI|nr:hypothetical protein [Mucilaginibacter mali]QKJ32919.1 hypothetical protein HQ865_25255 [Mucilaginibacter mali]
MKVIALNNIPGPAAEKPVHEKRVQNLLARMLMKDIHIFKSTSRQFLHNNQGYGPFHPGLIA